MDVTEKYREIEKGTEGTEKYREYREIQSVTWMFMELNGAVYLHISYIVS